MDELEAGRTDVPPGPCKMICLRPLGRWRAFILAATIRRAAWGSIELLMAHHLLAHRLLASTVALLAWTSVASSSVASEQKFEVKAVAEKKISELPPGPLFWRIDNFPTLAQAQAAAGPTGVAA